MIITAFHGLCMALADSVPGVSGGTIAFILGFYEKFLNSLHTVFRGSGAERKSALCYLGKLGLGWAVGMGMSAAVLSDLFSKNIYFMSSLFLGLTVCSIPFVASAEKEALRRSVYSSYWALLGAGLVIGLTALRSGSASLGSVNFAQAQPLQLGYIFLSGAVAITAMVLPGISGSSILLIAGVYLPTIQAVHSLLRLQLNVLPGLCALGCGVLAGVGVSIHAIRTALLRYRGQMDWLILGLMAGSLYAIMNGPASLDVPLPPLNSLSFQLPAFLAGAAILLLLELTQKAMESKGAKSV